MHSDRFLLIDYGRDTRTAAHGSFGVLRFNRSGAASDHASALRRAAWDYPSRSVTLVGLTFADFANALVEPSDANP